MPRTSFAPATPTDLPAHSWWAALKRTFEAAGEQHKEPLLDSREAAE
jgi:hypothetical protein